MLASAVGFSMSEAMYARPGVVYDMAELKKQSGRKKE